MGVNFVRVIAALGIIIYHISCYTGSDAVKVLYKYENGTFGNMFTMVFLLISGGVLYHNYPKITSLREFFYKRWKSIFPSFYIVFSCFYIKNVLERGSLFYYGRPTSILLSIFGLDGFFNYAGANYYLVGEWFLGAIIILYILYPLILKGVNKTGWLTIFILIALCVWKVETYTFGSVVLNRLAYYGGCFVLGMLIFKYKLYGNKILVAISVVVSAVFLFIKVNISNAYSDYILGVSLFFVMYALGELLAKVSVLNDMISFISGLTFPMFLVQNQISMYLVNRYTPTSLTAIIKTIFISVVLCAVSAWCTKVVVNAITHTKWFSYLEKHLIYRTVEKGCKIWDRLP